MCKNQSLIPLGIHEKDNLFWKLWEKSKDNKTSDVHTMTTHTQLICEKEIYAQH